MPLKLLQLNILFGTYIKEIIEYVKHEDFDILCFQEISGGRISKNSQNDFEYLLTQLKKYNGVLIKNISSSDDFFGNAIFVKKDIRVLKKEALFLTGLPLKIDFFKTDPKDVPKSALILKMETQSKQFTVVCAHLAWGQTPFDEEYKIKQADILLKKIDSLKNEPLILTGDFNLVKETQIVQKFSSKLNNLPDQNRIKYTLNPKIHRLHAEAIERNLAVDYIFVSDSVKVSDFQLVTEDLSDHYGLRLSFEI